jgi:hypothetical protein
MRLRNAQKRRNGLLLHRNIAYTGSVYNSGMSICNKFVETTQECFSFDIDHPHSPAQLLTDPISLIFLSF